MLEQRPATGLGRLRSPRRVTGHHVGRRPELVVADHVAHRLSVAPVGHHVVQEPEDRVEPRLEAHLGRDPRPLDEVDDLGDHGECGRERLLGEEGLTRLAHGGDQVPVEPRGRDHRDRVDVGIRDQVAAVGVAPRQRARDLLDLVDARGIRIGGSHELDLALLGEPPERRRVGPGDRSATDDAHPKCHRATLGRRSGVGHRLPAPAGPSHEHADREHDQPERRA